jgi:hypothetical protein
VHLLFADDAELRAESELELQHILNVFAEAVSAYGQEISVRKILVVQPRDTKCHVEDPYVSYHGEFSSSSLCWAY